MKILLVEDDLEISKLLSEFLQENGYEVFCQYDGLHVLDCLRENNIDLILLDIMLPYRNGDTVLTAVREWGKSSAKDLQEQRKRIGCMIETPALFPAMTAYQNMEIQRIQRGIPDKAVIEKTLNMVGLKDTGKKSVRNFSLGMRQRLGIAIALLNTPEFLILDEPINGLDPAGIVEVRNLLKSLNKEYGMTILVSSHILEELYQTATEFILIDKGKIIEEISDQELNERCKRHIAIKATDPQKALLVLEEKLHTENFKLLPDGTIRLYDYLDDLEKVAAVLSDAHILVTGLSVSGDTLEDYFLSKIGGSENVKSPKY